MQVWTHRLRHGTDFVFRRLHGKSDYGDVVAIFLFQISHPLQSRAARRTPRGPELNQYDASLDLIRREWIASEVSELELREGGELVGSTSIAATFLHNLILFAGK